MRIEITAEDIANGERRAPGFCPVALALRRQFPDAVHVTVGTTEACVRNEGPWTRWSLPLAANQFITRFDAAQPVEPAAFELARVLQ